MYSVFLVNFGYTHSVYSTLEQAIAGAEKTGFQCSIFKEGDPISSVKVGLSVKR